jgi:DNA-binding transcriptional regulator YdaS (Cro superfamily)
VEKGWDAAGTLAPLWHRVGGRDGLAALTGIGGTTLSSYNSGRRQLGMTNAQKIAAALDVTVEDLGAPPATTQPQRAPDRDVAELRREVARLREAMEAAQEKTHQTLDEIRALLGKRRSA